MITKGLVVRLVARPGKAKAVEEFLTSALPLVRSEEGTTAWFAVRFGISEFGIVDVFPDDRARDAHLNGPVARALKENAGQLLSRPPRIQKLDILADKLPAGAVGNVTRGVLLSFKPRHDRDQNVEQFLRNARALVEAEPRTTAWFAVRLDTGEYGIFDVFPDRRGQLAHLTGRVPRALTRHALSLLGSVPRMRLLDVFADKMGSAAHSPERTM